VKRLTLELDKTKLPVRVTEDTRQKLVNASTEFAAVESNAAAAEVLYQISSITSIKKRKCSIIYILQENY